MSGQSNVLTQKTGEFLACAELCRRGYIATSFSGNVPGYDLLIADEEYLPIPVQVKTTKADNWVNDASHWMHLEYDPTTQKQIFRGRIDISYPDLIYILVALANEHREKDRFFVLTKRQYQDVIIKHHCQFMDKNNWVRPRQPLSYDCRPGLSGLLEYENNWELISERKIYLQQ